MFGRFAGGIRNPVSERGDWVVSGQGVTSSGTPGSLTGWGSETSVGIGTPSSLLAVALPIAAAATGQPTVGQVEIDKINGRCTFYSPSVTGIYAMAVGIYIAELNSTATQWAVRDPSLAADAARDDYLYLETCTRSLCLPAAKTSWDGEEFELTLSQPVRIGVGQALCVTMALGSITVATATMLCGVFVRTHVRQAA